MIDPASIAAAYDATGRRWAAPARIYDRLAEEAVRCSPVPLQGRLVLDLGAGTGAASKAIAGHGGRPIALDPAHGMLLAALDPRGATTPPTTVQADALDLPLRTGSLGGVVAAFSLNHLTDPVRGLREAARVTAGGGPLVVTAYAADDDHPVKAATVAALTAAGWRAAPWYMALQQRAMPLLATPDRCLDAARRAGLDARCDSLRIAFPELSAGDLVAWRLGMAQHAPFVAGLDPAALEQVKADALDRLGPDHPTLVRSVLVLTAVVG